MQQWDCIIVGGGIAGLAARHALLTAGRGVLLLEKSRGLGGRTASRRYDGGGIADLGAQFFSVRNQKFKSLLQTSSLKPLWLSEDRQYPRFVHQEGMSKIAQSLTSGLAAESNQSPILRGTRALRLEPRGSAEEARGYRVTTDTQGEFFARTLLLTPPAPQCLELLAQSGFAPKSAEERELAECSFT